MSITLRSSIVVLCLLVDSAAFCQNDIFQSLHNEYRSFVSKSHEQFNEFRTKANEEYADFLQKAWDEYCAVAPTPRPKDQTPIVKPIPFNDRSNPIRNNERPIDEVIKPNPPAPRPQPISPIETSPSVPNLEFFFFGTPLEVHFDTSQRLRLPTINENSVSEAWRLCSNGKYDSLVADCLRFRDDLNFSDWAYLYMVNALSEKAYGNTSEAVVLAAYILCQSGYKIKLGIGDNKLHLLYASKHLIYDHPRYYVSGDFYYPFGNNPSKMRIADASFPGEKPMSLEILSALKLKNNPTDNRILKSKRYPEMVINVSNNKNIINFYDSYPTSEVGGNFLTRWAMYANTPIETYVRNQLYPQLMNNIKNCSELEAANKLLNWVQTAFVYEYDNKVWGGDRAFFAEESLFYPYCDCEDRSILFSHLVRDLLHNDVVLIYYPGHLATAVNFKNETIGDYIMIDGRKFTICDPTYINAPVGRTMPSMENDKAKAILLNRGG